MTDYKERSLHYGMGKNDETIYAYTREEWGVGAVPMGTSAHSIVGVLVTVGLPTILAIISATLFSVFFGAGNLIGVIISAFFFLLSGAWWGFAFTVVRKESKATDKCKAKGIPKAEYGVTDDQARKWFENHPGQVAITSENFPDSKLPFPS